MEAMFFNIEDADTGETTTDLDALLAMVAEEEEE